MVTAKIIHQTKIGGEICYEKDSAFQGTWKKILSYSSNPKKLSSLSTKINPSTKVIGKTISLKIPSNQVKTKQITINEITSFLKLKSNRKQQSQSSAIKSMPENVFKIGLLKIINETGTFKDWGGEKNDIYTNKLKIGSTRVHAAFALKGPGQKTLKLTPKHMGKNGDQIQRLAASPAQVLIVQYWGDIDQSVVELLRTHAIAKSYSEGQLIYYGIIDGQDSNRIIASYPNAFKK